MLLLYITDITSTPRLYIVYKTLFSVYTRAIQYVYFKYKTLEVAIGYSTNVSGLIYMLKHSNNTCMYKEKIYHSRDCAPDQDFIDKRLMLSVLLRAFHYPVFLLLLFFMLSFIIKSVLPSWVEANFPRFSNDFVYISIVDADQIIKRSLRSHELV